MVSIDPVVLAESLLDHPTTALDAEMVTKALAVHPLSSELGGSLERLFGLERRTRDIPVVAPMTKREVGWQLLNGSASGPALPSQLGRQPRGPDWQIDCMGEGPLR